MHLVPYARLVDGEVRHCVALKNLPAQLERWACPLLTSHSANGANTKCYRAKKGDINSDGGYGDSGKIYEGS